VDTPSNDLQITGPPTLFIPDRGLKGPSPKELGDLLFHLAPAAGVPENTRVIWVSHFQGYWGRHYFQVMGYPHDCMELAFIPAHVTLIN
jgi:hypothetical protein